MLRIQKSHFIPKNPLSSYEDGHNHNIQNGIQNEYQRNWVHLQREREIRRRRRNMVRKS